MTEIKLRMKNFGVYHDKEFTFPGKGSVLITGPSGAGKSTISDAIHFALFSTTNTRRFLSYGMGKSKECEVFLSMGGYDIHRKSGKGKVTVKLDNEVYEGEVADKILRKRFPSPEAFYQDQKYKYDFMGKTSKNQEEILQKLTGYDSKLLEALSVRKKTIDNKIKLCERDLVVYIQQLQREHPPNEDEEELRNTERELSERIEDWKHIRNLSEAYSKDCARKSVLQSQLEDLLKHDSNDTDTLSERLRVLDEDLLYHENYEKYKLKQKRKSIKKQLKELPAVNVDRLSKLNSEFEERRVIAKKLKNIPETDQESINKLSEELSSLSLSTVRSECPS